MKRFVFLATLFLVVLAARDLLAQGYKVIVNKSNPVSSMTKREVSNIFFKKTTTWNNGGQASPVDRKYTSGVRKKFSRGVLNKSVSAVKSYWQQRIFSGRGVPPPMKRTDAEVILHVSSHPGGIGYVSDRADTSRVKVIGVQ